MDTHRLLESDEQAPHPTGDGRVAMHVAGTNGALSGAEAHALGRALSVGPVRLVQDQCVRKRGIFRFSGTVVVSMEGIEFVSTGVLARLFRAGDEFIAANDVLAAGVQNGLLIVLDKGGRRLECQVRADRRLSLALGEVLAQSASTRGGHRAPDGTIPIDRHAGLLANRGVPAVSALPLIVAEDSEPLSPVLLPASVHPEAKKLRPGLLLVRADGLVWLARGRKAVHYNYRELSLGGKDPEDRQVQLFHSGERLTVHLAQVAEAVMVFDAIAVRLAQVSSEVVVDLSAFINGAESIEMEGDGVELLSFPVADVEMVEGGVGLAVTVELGWTLAVGSRVKISAVESLEIRWCHGLVVELRTVGPQEKRLWVRPVGLVHSRPRVRREHHRVEFPCAILAYRLGPLDSNGQRRPVARALVKLLDLSASGAGLHLRSAVAVGDLIRVVTPLDGLELDGRVVRCVPDDLGTRVGLRFIHRGEQQEKRLSKSLLELELRRARADNEELDEPTGELPTQVVPAGGVGS